MGINEYYILIFKQGLFLGVIGSFFAFYSSYLLSSVLDAFNKITR